MEFFLFMTGSASLLILSALLLRPLTGRVLPRALQMALWIAASLRLLLPVNIRTPFSILGLISALRPKAEPLAGTIPQSHAPSLAPVPALPVVPDPVLPAISEPAPSLSPAGPAASLSFLELLPWIWLCGAVLTASILLTLHLLEIRRCRAKTRDTEAERHTPRSVRVYRCRTAAPFAAGLFRPQIFLPETLPAADLPAVLAHECAHIRGLDILKKHLFAAALCVNWFNPLVWVMVYLAAQDLEILCDARALRRPDAPDAKTYAHALLNAEERRTLFTLGFSNHTEVRIMKILKKDKHNRILMLVSVLLVALLVTACTTTKPEETPAPAAPETTSVPEGSESIPKPQDKEDVSTEPASPAAPEGFLKTDDIDWDGLQVGMSWEEAVPFLAELTGTEDPVLIKPEGSLDFVHFPRDAFGGDGIVRVDFYDNMLYRISYILAFADNEAVEQAYDALFSYLEDHLGSPDRTNELGTHWDGTTGSLCLLTLPMGETYTEKHAVQIQITDVYNGNTAEKLHAEDAYIDTTEAESRYYTKAPDSYTEGPAYEISEEIGEEYAEEIASESEAE